MKTTIKFALERETKGAVRFQEIGDDGKPRSGDEQNAHVGSLYLRKKQLNGELPKELTVEIIG